RQSSLHKKKKQRFVKTTPNATAPSIEPSNDDEYNPTTTAIPVLLDTKADRVANESVGTTNILDLLPEKPEGKLSSKKRKRLEKFIQSQLKKEERVKLVKKLGEQHLEDTVGDLLKSSKDIGHGKLTAKERLRQSLKEHKSGIAISDPNSRLFVAKEVDDAAYDDYMDDVDEDDDDDDEEENDGAKGKSVPTVTFGADLKTTVGVSTSGFGSSLKAPVPAPAVFGASLKRAADGSTVGPTIVKRKKKKQVKKKKEERKFSGVSSDEDDEDDDDDEEDGEEEEEEGRLQGPEDEV
ncbi:putative ATP-dependent RNA helicase DHR1, partial [Rhizoclosmatium hyalinum]